MQESRLKKTITCSCKIYLHGLSMLDNSLLKSALNSPLERARVAPSLECGKSMKVYTLLIAVVGPYIYTAHLHDGLDIYLMAVSLCMAFEYLILTYQRPFFFLRERFYRLASYDISTQQSVSLYTFLYNMAGFPWIICVKKINKTNRILLPHSFSYSWNCHIFLA